MGAIIYWAIIRTAILIPILWIGYDFLEYKFWLPMALLSIYGVIVHPAIIQFKLFNEQNKEIIENTLCSTCTHFNETAVLCLKYDQHPTADKIPCEGLDWESSEYNQ